MKIGLETTWINVPDGGGRYTNEVTDMGKVRELVSGFKDALFVSNWAELVPNELCVVVRCHPVELIKRLSDRNYPITKIQENVEAECLDYCLISAVENCEEEKVAEIDNTKGLDINSDRVAGIIKGELEPEHGKTDFSEFVDKVPELIRDSV